MSTDERPDSKGRSLRAPRYCSPYQVTAILVVLVALLTSVVLAQREQDAAQGKIDAQTRDQASEIVGHLQSGFDRYEQALNAEKALYASSNNEVSAAGFSRFVTQLGLTGNYPALQGVGFIQVVRQQQKAGFVAEMRAAGHRAYQVTPSGQRPQYWLLRHQKTARTGPGPVDQGSTSGPHQPKIIDGFDIATNPSIAPFLQSARDTGQATLTGKAFRGADLKTPPQQRHVFITLVVPIYRPGADLSTVNSRRAAIFGWVSASFRGQNLVASSVAGSANRELGVQLFDVSVAPDRLIGSYPAGFRAAQSALTQSVRIGGRSWVLQFAPLVPTATQPWYEHVGLLAGGLGIGLLLASLLWLYGMRASERVAAEAKLRHSESTFRAAFDDALVGMCLTGLNGHIIRANQVFADMLGRDPDQLAGVHHRELSHQTDQTRDALTSLLNGEVPGFRTEKRFVHVDGSEVRAELSAALIRDEHGKPLYFASQTVDITARWRAERDRATRNLMLAGILANSQSLIHVKDLQGRYLLANEPFRRGMGRTEEELIGHDDFELQTASAERRRAEDLQAQRQELHLEQVHEDPSGTKYFETAKFPLHDADGKVYATCAVALEVTTSRRAAAEMEAARDAAVAASQAKSAFLATMSHELRTPMNAVIGMTGLLLDTELDEEQRQFVETVRTSGDALLATINDILDFSKLEAHEVELEVAPLELQSCLEEAVSLVANSAVHLDLVVHLDAGCPRVVRGDLHRLRQVLVNLVGNAVKFTQHGDVLLSVTPSETSAATGPGEVGLTFSVRDTGIGIPQDRLDRLFKSFSQVDASTTRVYGGSGLGLAISRAIVEAMGGDIRVTSTVGVGSSFSFDLVMLTADVDELLPVGTGSADLAARRALVVDDNDTNRRILRLQLEDWGMRCIDVADGEQGLAILAGDPRFDVAILDMHMPGMDGEQLARRIRKLPRAQHLPLLLLTSVGTTSVDRNLFQAFHPKPVRADILKALLRTLFADSLDSESSSVGRTAGPSQTPAQRALKVLVAEDNPVNQAVMRAMLGRLGHSVQMADNGQEALEETLRSGYDVVLMDVHMPTMDGLAATRAIRTQLPSDAQPRIIALTASSLDEDRNNCAEAGMDGYLLKPVRLQQLASSLSAAIGKPAQQGVKG